MAMGTLSSVDLEVFVSNGGRLLPVGQSHLNWKMRLSIEKMRLLFYWASLYLLYQKINSYQMR